MEDEVEDVVGVLFRGEGAGDVAGDFEEAADGDGGEVPGAVADELVGVEKGGEGEEDGAEQGER